MTRQLFFTFRFAIRESVEGVKGSIANQQRVLPLSEVALEAHALGNLKRRDYSTLECLAALSGSFARGAKFLPRPVEVSRKCVMLAGLELGEQLTGALLNLGEFRNERLAVHIVIVHDIASVCKSLPFNARSRRIVHATK